MPTERFLHLPDEKRQCIMAAARAELSRVPYEEISINRIVHSAGIARGSFYQYFKGKEDLLEYIIRDLRDSFSQIMDRNLYKDGADVFATAVVLLRAALEMGTNPEHHDFYRHLFSATLPCGAHSFSLMRIKASTLVQQYAPRLDLSNFISQSPEDLATLAEMLSALMRSTVVKAFSGETDADTAALQFEKQLAIIRRGVLREGGASHG